MTTRIKSLLLNALGLFFLAYGVFAVDYAIYRDQPSWAFWICYVGMVLIGIGLLVRNSKLVVSQLYLLTFPLIIWLTDFTSKVVTGEHWLGVTDYFFKELLLPARLISLEHFIVLPLGYFGFWLLGGERKGAWLLSLVEVTIIYLIIRTMTDPLQNVNCVFESCLPYVPTDSFYPLRWFGVALATILASLAAVELSIYLFKKITYNKKGLEN